MPALLCTPSPLTVSRLRARPGGRYHHAAGSLLCPGENMPSGGCGRVPRMTGDVHTTKPLADAEWLATSGAWGVYRHDPNTEAGELVGATFGEDAQARAELFVAALELSRVIGEEQAKAKAEPEDLQPDFSCAIERKPVKAIAGQNERCAEQCEHCRGLAERTVMFGGAEFAHDTGTPNATAT